MATAQVYHLTRPLRTSNPFNLRPKVLNSFIGAADGVNCLIVFKLISVLSLIGLLKWPPSKTSGCIQDGGYMSNFG